MSACECNVVHMPRVDGTRWRNRRAELDLRQGVAAAALDIAQGTLRNIETNPGFYVSLRVIHRASRLYSRDAGWLQGKDDPEPAPKDEPRRQPSGDPKGPEPRKNGHRDRKGPARTEMKAAS